MDRAISADLEMASPTAVSNSISMSESRRRKKKLKSSSICRDEIRNRSFSSSWKSEKTEQVYSSKLLNSLKKLRISPKSSPPSLPRRGRAVREAADQALAVAARGRTRWSRAILTNRLKLKFMKNKKQKRTAKISGGSRKPRLGILRLKGKDLPAVHRKVQTLGRLVPGCRKEAFPVILEEATDYIAALEMQIRAMTTLTELLTRSGAGGESSSSVAAAAVEHRAEN